LLSEFLSSETIADTLRKLLPFRISAHPFGGAQGGKKYRFIVIDRIKTTKL